MCGRPPRGLRAVITTREASALSLVFNRGGRGLRIGDDAVNFLEGRGGRRRSESDIPGLCSRFPLTNV
jgi:hypothetical protein